LRDLDGNRVRFRDLEADYILLDFWGSWCVPCLESIPHLVDLQKRYGPRLKVIGIAYETGAPADRIAAVSAAAKRLGIDYTILLAEIDGPCPLKEALRVDSLPTMILLSNDGRVLHREQGSSNDAIARLDRVVARAFRPMISRSR
jgi:thiol-disulfide isomerase/thioredoxin